MKILQLISSAGFFGAESVCLELSRELSSQNIDNIIGIFENFQNPHTEIAQYAKESNLKAKIFRCRGRFDIGTLREIEKFVRNNDIDIIHTHGSKPNAYGFVAARLTKRGILSTCHNRIENSIVQNSSHFINNYLSNKFYYSIDKLILQRFDRVIAVSEDVKRMLFANKVEEKRILIIMNGVNTEKLKNTGEKITIKEELNINIHDRIIGTVARLTEEKGLFNLIAAARDILTEIPNIFFIIVGDGPLKSTLINKSLELGIKDKVLFIGQRNDLPNIYAAMDIFVLSSLVEGLPMVLLEAMAAKKPIIATNVGAIPSVIENMKDGMLVNPGDIDQLKKAILFLLKNEKFGDSLAKNGFYKVINNFSSRTMCNKYIKVYEEILK